MATPTTTLWERDPHTAAKHALLNRYLAAWYPIMAKQFRDTGITFADGFAGPGEYTNSTESSPAIAAQHALRSDVVQYGTPSKLVFLEEDRARFEHLSRLLENRFPSSERPSYVTVTVHRGSCESDLLPALSAAGAWNGPVFANLDGWGVDAPFTVVERIAKQRSSEVLVTFQDQWFTRFATLDEQTAGDRVFGNTAWRAVATRPTHEKKSFLVTQYRHRLAEVGLRFTLTFEMVDEGGHSLFLVFGTTSEDGIAKMKDAVWEVDRVGGARFRDPRDPAQLTFSIDEPDFSPLRRAFVDSLRTGPSDLETLSRFALLETLYKRAHAKPVIDCLVDDTVVKQVKNGRSYAEKVYALTNDGNRAEQQGSLFG